MASRLCVFSLQEIRQLLEDALDSVVDLFAIFDYCFSEGLSFLVLQLLLCYFLFHLLQHSLLLLQHQQSTVSESYLFIPSKLSLASPSS